MKSNESLNLKPGTGRVFWIPTKTNEGNGANILVDPLPQNEVLDRLQVHVKRALCKTVFMKRKLCVQVSVDNVGMMDVTITRGTILASVSVVDAEDLPVTPTEHTHTHFLPKNQSTLSVIPCNTHFMKSYNTYLRRTKTSCTQ